MENHKNNMSYQFLLIDDNENDLKLIKRRLAKDFPEAVFTTCSGKAEFDNKIQWVIPNVIMCDNNLTDTNGLEMLLYIKEKWDYPFIFVTGTLNNEEQSAAAILKGASGYVLKDNIDHLPEVVREVLRKREAQQEEKTQKVELMDRLVFNIGKLEEKISKLDLKDKSTLELITDIKDDFNKINQ